MSGTAFAPNEPCPCRWCTHVRTATAPTPSPSSRQRGPFPAKAAHDRRLSSADEADLRDDGGTS